MAVKLRKTAGLNGATNETGEPIALTPLSVSGVVISKAALIDALRIYVPSIVTIEVIEDGERFLLTLQQAASNEGSA